MGAKRILLGAVLAGLASGPALGQTGGDGLFPARPTPTAGPEPGAAGVTPGGGPGPSAATPLTPAVPAAASPTDTLTNAPPATGQLPRGAYGSPWCGGAPAGCGGPFGAHGPIGYELYSNTGVSLPVTGGAFIGTLRAGVMTGGGGRSLLFDAGGQSAWVFDLGVTYTHNSGDNVRVLQVFTPPALDSSGNQTTPDQVNSYYLRALHRTSFNFAIGRDWWLNGHGNVNETSGPNWRAGAEVGGRWGTAHVDLIPVGDQFNYFRRQDTFHSLFVGTHVDCEVPMGGWILFGGLSAQYNYDWMNILPPMDSDLQSVNLLLRADKSLPSSDGPPKLRGNARGARLGRAG